jgi:hypothetical protein
VKKKKEGVRAAEAKRERSGRRCLSDSAVIAAEGQEEGSVKDE